MIDTIPMVETEEESYIGKDGLKRCKKCGGKLETIVTLFAKTKKVNCVCKCYAEKREAERTKEEKLQKENAKMFCFRNTNTRWCTFDQDNRNKPQLSDAMMKYAENFRDFKKDGKGLVLYGNVGTGKTFFSACIANKLIDDGYTCLITNFSQLINKLQGMWQGKEEYIESLNRYDLLIIDDLGVERNTEYAQEIVYAVIDSRYRSGLPLIVTTNLNAEELTNPSDVRNQRVFDRIIERCFPIHVDGENRRKARFKNDFADMKERLGM